MSSNEITSGGCSQKVGTWSLIVAVATAILLFTSTCFSQSPSVPISLNLHPYEFPVALDVQAGVFYLSADQLGVFFDTNPLNPSSHSDDFKLLVLSTKGQITAQRTIRADPNAMDIAAGPSGGILFGREGTLDLYDSNLAVKKSVSLEPTTTGIKFDRQRNQLVMLTVEREAGHSTAHFIDGNTMNESVRLAYPMTARAVFGGKDLIYTVSGDCKGSAHFVSSQSSWQALDSLPACDVLTFVGDDSLAYAFDGKLYIVGSDGKRLFQAPIPAYNSFQTPHFVGLSDDNTRLAISALNRKSMSSTWPYYYEVFIYDLASKRMMFKRPMPSGSGAAALSPDGHQLATVEQGTLMLTDLQ